MSTREWIDPVAYAYAHFHPGKPILHYCFFLHAGDPEDIDDPVRYKAAEGEVDPRPEHRLTLEGSRAYIPSEAQEEDGVEGTAWLGDDEWYWKPHRKIQPHVGKWRPKARGWRQRL